MEHAGAQTSPRRLRTLARLGLFWVLVLTLRLGYLQIYKHDEYQKIAESQQNRELEIEAARGEIRDRNGQPLAMNVPAQSAFANPRLIGDARSAAARLAKALDLDAQSLEERIRFAQQKERFFVWIKRRLTPEEHQRVVKLGLDHLQYRQETRRVYPSDRLAANVLGWVNAAQRGAGGLEQSLDGELRGQAGMVRLVTDSRRRGVDSQVEVEAEPGTTIGLAIDARIQHVADTSLRKAVMDTGSETGSVVVLDPYSGDVLAMSSYPSFDPNEPLESMQSIQERMNRAASAPYEPGSVFKVVTFSALLENTRFRPDSRIDVGRGAIRLRGRTIHDHAPYDKPTTFTMTEVLTKSSNVGTAYMADQLGMKDLAEYVHRFGFGEKTRIPVPGESPGITPNWGPNSVPHVAIGHEIGTTTLQLARAGAVIANGGYMVEPRLVLWKQRPHEDRRMEPEGAKVRILRPETTTTLRKMMEQVVLEGTGGNARLAGYTSGGKTGSAQIFDFETKHYTHLYNSSYMGFAPVGNPNVVVVVTLNGARQYGGIVATPVFQDVASAAMRVRQVTRDIPDDQLVTSAETRPAALMADASAPPEAPGFDSLAPPEDAVASDGVLVGPRVPDFQGTTLSDALQASVALGLPLDVEGRGLVRSQYPLPGQILASGERVRLTFAR
jgi:cell division protein FtsI (penicillin-binding protein 3)